jgi:hypothetical protein
MTTKPSEVNRKTLPAWRGLSVLGLGWTAALGACVVEPPEAALTCAREASVAEDREAYAACFTPRSRAFLGAWWQAVGAGRPDLLPAGGDTASVREVRPLHDPEADSARALLVVEEGGTRDLRVIVHELGGRWRIDLWDTAGAQFGLRGL